MSEHIKLFKVTIEKEIQTGELEERIAASGGLIQRVDQLKGKTVVFFSGTSDASDECKKSLAKAGKVEIDTSSERELRKLP